MSSPDRPLYTHYVGLINDLAQEVRADSYSEENVVSWRAVEEFLVRLGDEFDDIIEECERRNFADAIRDTIPMLPARPPQTS